MVVFAVALILRKSRTRRKPYVFRPNATYYKNKAQQRSGIRPDPPAPNTAIHAIKCWLSRLSSLKLPRLDREEARLLPVLEYIVRNHGDGHRVTAQVSLGEVIRVREGKGSPEARKAGYAPINSRRLDFAVVNRFGHLTAAIEYQGSGHPQNTSFMRDATKREALRKAVVPVIEALPGFQRDDVTRKTNAILVPQRPDSQPIAPSTPSTPRPTSENSR